MKISIAQLDPSTGAFDNNLEAALAMAERAQEAGSELVIYPDFALCGDASRGIVSSDAFVDAARTCTDEFARLCPVPAIIGSVHGSYDLPEGEPGYPDAFYCVAGKAHPLFADAEQVALIEIGGLDVAVCMGEPLIFEGTDFNIDLIIELASEIYEGIETLTVAPDTLDAARGRATAANAWLVHCNLVGGQDEDVFSGGSFVLSPKGSLTSLAALFKPDCLHVGIGKDANGDTVKATHIDEVEADCDALVLAIHDYWEKNRLTDCVIGLSGGIDSAVVAALACKALGPEHVHGVLMPGPYSSEGSIVDAAQLAANLGMDTCTVPIDGPLDALTQAIAPACGGTVEGLAKENLQARIRTVYLMTLSNTFGWVLLNTGNKSEAAMGFSTLYGDTAGAYAPLGDIYKTRVFELAEYINASSATGDAVSSKAADGLIPRAIIEKAPSAELYEDARDEDRLPPYELLDQILAHHIDEGWGLEELVLEGFDMGLCSEVLATVSKCEFKRRQEPLGPEISGASFSMRGWPISNGFVDKG